MNFKVAPSDGLDCTCLPRSRYCARGLNSVHVPYGRSMPRPSVRFIPRLVYTRHGVENGRNRTLPPPGLLDVAPLTIKSGVSLFSPFSPSLKNICGRLPQPDAEPALPSV